MNKTVMLSIRPKWCAKIIIGRKTMELRKSVPKLEVPFKCYIYCTSGHPYMMCADDFCSYGERKDGGDG